MKKHNKAVEAHSDKMSENYKATAIQAAKDMPAEGTLEKQSKYVIDQMIAAHKEIVWGVVLVKYTPGKWTDTAYMWKSLYASQYLSVRVGDDLLLQVFVLQS